MRSARERGREQRARKESRGGALGGWHRVGERGRGDLDYGTRIWRICHLRGGRGVLSKNSTSETIPRAAEARQARSPEAERGARKNEKSQKRAKLPDAKE